MGNIYHLGRHRLMCGDSTNPDDVAKLMNGVKADLVFTDPPYGIKYQSGHRVRSAPFDMIINDDKILDFLPIIKEYNTGFVFIMTIWKTIKDWIIEFEKHFKITDIIVWYKKGGGMGDLQRTFSPSYEMILCSNNGKKICGKRLENVWSVPRDNRNCYFHPTQKPIALPMMAIENTTKENDIVLDLFGGSGSTLFACEKLNRSCYTMEISEKYIDIIINRYETLQKGF